MKRRKPTKTRVKRSTLIRKLDHAFSRYIRQFYADRTGWVACYTCGKRYHWKQIQNGHYVSRSCIALRWNIDNCRPQCAGCNIFRKGQPITFRENLVKELGEEAVLLLEAQRFKVFKPDLQYFEDLLLRYNK